MGFDSGGGGGSVPSGTLTASSFGGSTEISTSLDTWFQVDPDNPVLLTGAAGAATDGTLPAVIDLQVDEDGGTTQDYEVTAARARPQLGNGAKIVNTITISLPGGAQARFNNTSNPAGANSLAQVRATIINPDA